MNTVRIDRLVNDVSRLTLDELREFQRRLGLKLQPPPGAGSPVSQAPKRPSGKGGAKVVPETETEKVVAGIGTVIETGGSARMRTLPPECPACKTTRVNLCRYDADVSAGRQPSRRPMGCLVTKLAEIEAGQG